MMLSWAVQPAPALLSLYMCEHACLDTCLLITCKVMSAACCVRMLAVYMLKLEDAGMLLPLCKCPLLWL